MNVTPAAFDPHDPVLLADPYPMYARLRDERPIAPLELGGRRVWTVARWEDVAAVFAHPNAHQRPLGGGVPTVLGDGPGARMFSSSMSQADPPQHTRLRRLAAGAFSPRMVAQMQESIDAAVASAMARIAHRDTCDVVADVALEIPMTVICELIGVGGEDWPRLLEHTPDVLRVFMPEGNTPDELERCHRACAFFFEFLGEMIEERRRRPRNDLMTALVRASDEGGALLSDDELCGVLRGLLTAGFETTAGTISAAFLAFTAFPEQYARLRSDPGLIDSMTEEVLRWEAPVQAQPRYVHEDVVLGGVRVPAGEQLWLLIGSANHDPSRYPEPWQLRADRGAADHFSFGGGRHVCIGAGLARAEIRSTLRSLVASFEGFELLEAPTRRTHFQFRSLTRLEVGLRR